MADFDAQQPVRTTATEFTTEVANASGTTINPAEEFPQGSTTSGQSGVLVQGAVTTSAPSYTTGQTDPLSLTTAGALRVDGSGATQPVSGTVTANQGTPNTAANSWPVEMTDGTNILGTSSHPVRTDPTGTTTQPVSGTVTANAGTGTFAVNETQIDGTAVSVNTGNADAGTQRVVLASNQPAVSVTFGVPGTPTYDYATSTAVASAGTATHSVAGPINIDKVVAAASGELKVTIAWGTTGSEVTYMVGFTSASDKTFQYPFPYPIALTSGQSNKITLKNQDTSAMDVYSTVAWH